MRSYAITRTGAKSAGRRGTASLQHSIQVCRSTRGLIEVTHSGETTGSHGRSLGGRADDRGHLGRLVRLTKPALGFRGGLTQLGGSIQCNFCRAVKLRTGEIERLRHGNGRPAGLALRLGRGLTNLCGNAGTLLVNGSIAQRWRGIVGQNSGGTQNGYTKLYQYDTRLQYSAPPYFPRWANSQWSLRYSGETTTPAVVRNSAP